MTLLSNFVPKPSLHGCRFLCASPTPNSPPGMVQGEAGNVAHCPAPNALRDANNATVDRGEFELAA